MRSTQQFSITLPNEMAEAMNEVLAERLSLQIFSVGVDVVVGDFVERVLCVARKARFTGLERINGGLLCS